MAGADPILEPDVVIREASPALKCVDPFRGRMSPPLDRPRFGILGRLVG